MVQIFGQPWFVNNELGNETFVTISEISQQLIEHFIGPAQNTSKWTKALPQDIKPKFPINFKSVHAISAQNGQLGNLREIIGSIYSKLHPLNKQKFEEDELEEKRRRKFGNKKLL